MSMKSHEAMQQAIGRKTEAFSKALNLSPDYIRKMKRPKPSSSSELETGRRNPLDVLETIMTTALKNNRERSDALAPMFYLARQFNCALIDIPPHLRVEPDELTTTLLESIEEFGQLAGAASDALKDRIIQPDDLKRIHKEGWEAIEKIMAFMKASEEAVQE